MYGQIVKKMGIKNGKMRVWIEIWKRDEGSSGGGGSVWVWGGGRRDGGD